MSTGAKGARGCFDVAVVGGGPAGSATAIELARIGASVAILERERFPRPHVGICLASETLELTKYLGLEEGHGGAHVWPRQRTASLWASSELRVFELGGIHVDRGALDKALLGQALEAGAELLQPCRLLRSRYDGEFWTLTASCDSGAREIRARFLVDGAGRRGAVTGSRVRDSMPVLGLHATWELGRVPLFQGLIESSRESWIWFAQTSAKHAQVSVFCDPRRLRGANGAAEAYHRLLSSSQGLANGVLAQPCTSVRGGDASADHATVAIDDRVVRVGDACVSIDPLSSQGVHEALLSGIQGAAAVHTILQHPSDTAAAIEFYVTRADRRVSRHQARAVREYARVAAVRSDPFWARHGDSSNVAPLKTLRTPPPPPAPRELVSLSEDVELRDAPVLEGRHVKYRRVLMHPHWSEPVLYMGGVDLVELAAHVPNGTRFSALASYWRGRVPARSAGDIALWMWQWGVLVSAGRRSRHTRTLTSQRIGTTGP